jgi:hypothetical protein
MRAREFITEELALKEVEVVWGRTKPTTRGGKVNLKFRCTTGPRKSRQVSHPSKCHDHPDVAAAQRMKTTRARTKVQAARRTQRTKSLNTASVLANRLNTGKAKTPKSYY